MKIPHPIYFEIEPSDGLENVLSAAALFAKEWQIPVNFKFNEDSYAVFEDGTHQKGIIAILPN